MALENLTGSNVFITNLVPSNPAGTDPVSEGDNHIAGTKNVLLNSFPAINGAVTATPADLNKTSTLDTVYAKLDSPAFIGIPTAPTAAPGTSTTQIATTEFSMGSGIGSNQTWQDVKASRVSGTNYTNNTGKPIMVNITWFETNNGTGSMVCDGVTVASRKNAGTGADVVNGSMIVPNGSVYSATSSPNTFKIWAELR